MALRGLGRAVTEGARKKRPHAGKEKRGEPTYPVDQLKKEGQFYGSKVRARVERDSDLSGEKRTGGKKN